MLFNSFDYILGFLPISVLAFYALNKVNLFALSRAWLVLASLFFLGYGSISYLPIIIISIVSNYCIGRSLMKSGGENTHEKKRAKRVLVCGIFFNIFLLALFKYADFFLSNFNLITNSHIPLVGFAFPLAISFYTFQQLTYLVDSYHGKVTDRNFINYSLFVTFFPQLIAGPILRYGEIMPQFENAGRRSVDYRNMSLGLYIFFTGLCKRVIVADSLGVLVDLGFSRPESLACTEAWATSFFYTFQLYFDFSGYIDMAVGSAYFFNIKLPPNFNSPYLSVSIRDFWRRWHITLSRFLRDYIYVPLGGNRNGEARACFNIIATFLIGGIWHGANNTFVVWGAMHGLGATLHRLWEKQRIRMPKIMAICITFLFVNTTWVFFRSQNMNDAFHILKSMAGLNSFYGFSAFQSVEPMNQGMFMLIFLMAVLIVFFAKNTNNIPERFTSAKKDFAYVTAMIMAGILYLNSTIPKDFLYFDF